MDSHTTPPDNIHFEVQGSAEEPYQVIFFKSGTQLRTHCDCDAGRNGLHCKHRLRILAGSRESIVKGNLADITTVQKWMIGSDIEKALTLVADLEQQAAAIKKQLSAAKKSLGRIMSLD